MILVLAKSTSSHFNLNFDVNTYIFQKCQYTRLCPYRIGAKVNYQQRDCFVTLLIQFSTNAYIGAIAFGGEHLKEVLPRTYHSGAAVSQELKIFYLNISGLLHANHSECKT